MKVASRRRRRLVVQLAALVDLLFVVMFLQFTELQQASVVREESRENALTASAEAEVRRENADELKTIVLADHEKLRQDRDRLQTRVAELERELAATQQRTSEAQARADDQIREIGNAVKDLLVGVALDKFKAQMNGASDDQRMTILQSLKEAQGKNAAQVIQILRKSAELQKRCDVLEVHLFPDGNVRIRAPSIGIQERKFLPKTKDDFSSRFMELVKEASEPKSLVLILFTYGNAEYKSKVEVTKGLEQVRTIWGGELAAHKSVQVTAPGYSSDAP
jgi:hypothetical protein